MFAKNVLVPVVVVLPFFFAIPWGISQLVANVWFNLLLGLFAVVAVVFVLGITKHERRFVLSKIPILKKYI